MKVYGMSRDLKLFSKYGLRVLEEAGLDYMKGLAYVEIYLGQVFSSEAGKAGPYQIFDTKIDICRQLFGEKAVKIRINSYLGRELGHMVQKFYLPKGSSHWQEIERMLGFKLDYNVYYSRISGKRFCLAEETVANLFDHAINGCNKITLTRLVAEEQAEEETQAEKPQFKPVTVFINPHLWRKWFYRLWNQNYEWGCFCLNEDKALANGFLYSFPASVKVINNIPFVPAKELLEAHGFKIVLDNQGKVEYWK